MTEITTSAELDALPVGSVVLADATHQDSSQGPGVYHLAFQRLYDGRWHRGGRSRDTDPDFIIPATVLFRPDAPQPATGDAVERAAESVRRVMRGFGFVMPAEDARGVARAVLAAARAGEAQGFARWSEDRAAAVWEVLREHGVSTGSLDDTIVRDLIAAAQRGEEAVDRQSLASHILATLPDEVWQEASDIIAVHAADAALDFLAARGDAAPTEAEWGVRYPLGGRVVVFDEEHVARSNARSDRATLVQRTVSAWREVS